jgi:hypothetical protein
LSSGHSEKVKDRLFVIPRRSQTDEGLFPTFRLSIHQACKSSMQKDLTYNNLQNIKPQAFRISGSSSLSVQGKSKRITTGKV